VWAAAATLGEGPVWVERDSALYWVDIKAPAVHRYRPGAAQRRSWPAPETIGCLCPRAARGFVAGLRSGFAVVDLDAATFESLGGPEADRPDNRMNDGTCDSRGRIWAGTMDDAEARPTGSLYRLDPDRRWRRMDGGYAISNGPAFSPDGATLYHTDTLARVVYVFDHADGALANKRRFITVPPEAGFPDGMTVDEDGFLWIAHFGGWRVVRYDPKGRIDRALALPVSNVTSCAFGGPSLDTLYITTATKDLTDSARAGQPLAGGLFVAEVHARGLPPTLYAG
jgi:sugar lactone lactonase YvrE